jgi:hypothetical protein
MKGQNCTDNERNRCLDKLGQYSEQLTTIFDTALKGRWIAAVAFVAQAGRKEPIVVLRFISEAPLKQARSDCELLHSSSDQLLRRRAEQQAQGAQTALLWAATRCAPVPTPDT